MKICRLILVVLLFYAGWCLRAEDRYDISGAYDFTFALGEKVFFSGLIEVERSKDPQKTYLVALTSKCPFVISSDKSRNPAGGEILNMDYKFVNPSYEEYMREVVNFFFEHLIPETQDGIKTQMISYVFDYPISDEFESKLIGSGKVFTKHENTGLISGSREKKGHSIIYDKEIVYALQAGNTYLLSSIKLDINFVKYPHSIFHKETIKFEAHRRK